MSTHDVASSPITPRRSRGALKAPFPYFGGKSKVADLVWDRFGDVPNYVEPFAGSLAVLLARPHTPTNETVNDIDCMISNFWRAVTVDPEAVAHACDWPVNECDLTARHQWLVDQDDFIERMKTDPDHYDAKIAGWWVWGISQWIGDGWCSRPDWSGRGNGSRAPRGIHAKRPDLKRGGMGVNRQLPDVSHPRGIDSAQPTRERFLALQDRLRRVRVCCGDWARILGPSATTKIGLTGVFLDPPYGDVGRHKVYAHDSFDVATKVREWALEHGGDPMMRIALCGYADEHDMPGWHEVAWKTRGGYGNQGNNTRGRVNANRERIWFSPHCRQIGLFE